MKATWEDLGAELDLWHAAGEEPTFWWRDDDCEAPGAALDQLIAITARHSAPLHLAVIPHQIDPGLARRLEAAPHVWSMPHGFRHKNHEPKPARASEMGMLRPLEETKADLQEGWRRMQKAGLPRCLPVQVPPWTRIGDKVVPHLADWGFAGLSGFGPRRGQTTDARLLHVNAHVEPLRWRPDAQFAGDEKVLGQAVEHLRARREGTTDKDEPTGLVTHHLQTPEEVWDFCDAFAARLAHRGRARWIEIASLLRSR